MKPALFMLVAAGELLASGPVRVLHVNGATVVIVALGRALVSGARRDDLQALASLMHYPLVVNFVVNAGGKRTIRPQSVPSKSAVLARYRAIFTASFMRQLRQDEPRFAF